MTEEEMIKNRIAKLREEIEEKEKQGEPTHRRGIVTKGVYDSELGVKVPMETTGLVPLSPEERETARKQRDLEIDRLRYELVTLQGELHSVVWNKPENVEKRQREAIRKQEERQEEQLKEERLEHEERYDDLNQLVKYLQLAGMHDLAQQLTELRFAFLKPKNDYVTSEIDLRSKEKSFRTKTQTTKKEYKEIKRSVVRLTKDATRMAKKYKDLYELYLSSWEIIDDMKNKGILEKRGDELVRTVESYFKQPKGTYYFRDKGSMNHYSLKESPNLGYERLAFYRDYNNKYNEDVRKHRI